MDASNELQLNLNDEVELEAEGHIVKCSRELLVNKSDYFRAMFLGNFAESLSKKITLKDVNYAALNLLLTALQNNDLNFLYRDMYHVLETSCMLQFIEVKDYCVQMLFDTLSLDNCLEIWTWAEKFELQPLCVMAKFLGLLHFDYTCCTTSFQELQLNSVCKYLSSCYLNVENELMVFNSVLNWLNNEECPKDTLISLLLCLNLNALSDENFDTISRHELITNYTDLIEALNCFRTCKRHLNCDHYSEQIKSLANHFLQAKSRSGNGLMFSITTKNSNPQNDTNQMARVAVLDDTNNGELVLKTVVDIYNILNLYGFALVGWREIVFIFGGEFGIGRGCWNYDIYQYSIIRPEISYVCDIRLPYPRRNFEYCICDDNLYIIGGTGSFRVIKDNMFWYSFREQKFGPIKEFPTTVGRHIKVCSLNKQLLLYNIHDQALHMYEKSTDTWRRYSISCNVNIQPVFPQLAEQCSIFTYKGKLFIKDDKLTEISFLNDTFSIVQQTVITKSSFNSIKTLLNNNILYSIYLQQTEDLRTERVIFEKIHMDSMEMETDSKMEKLLNDLLNDNKVTNMFNMLHFNMLYKEEFVCT